MQIKQLENQIEQPLFEQMGKKLFLTEAGREVRMYAGQVLQQVDNLEAGLATLKGLERGTLSISVATTAHYFAPKLLSIFCERYPGVNVKLDVTNRETLISQMENNTVDMVVMGRPPERVEVDAAPFMDNPLVLIAPANHPFGRERSIQIKRLEGEAFLVREEGSGTRRAMEKFFEQHGIHMNMGMEVSSDEAIKQSVQAGLGLGIMSRDAVQNELHLGLLIVPDVLHFPIMRQWYVMHRRGKRLSPIAQAFKSFLVEEAAKILKKDVAKPHLGGASLLASNTAMDVPPAGQTNGGPGGEGPQPAERRYEPARPQTVLTGPDGKPIPPAPRK